MSLLLCLEKLSHVMAVVDENQLGNNWSLIVASH